MKTLIIFFIVCAAVVFGGKLYTENRYKKELDQAINQARSEVDVSYDDLTIGFDGSITIHDISFSNADGTGSFTIKEATAISSDRFAPFKKDLFKNGDTPEWIKVSVNQFVIDAVLAEPDVKDECSSFENAFILSEIGIKQLYASASISLDFKDLNNAEADIHYEDQTGTLDLKVIYSMHKATQFAVSYETIPIDNAQLTAYLEPEFATKFIDYCAKKLDMTNEQYLSDVIASPKYSYDSFGYNFGDKVSDALVTYMKGGHNLSFFANPSNTLKNFPLSSQFSTKEIIRQLNLTAKLDGEPVLVKSNTNNNFENIDEETGKPLVIHSKRRTYQPVSISKIPKLIDKKVKIWRKGNKSRIDGRINDFVDGIAIVEIRKFGGKAIFEISTEDIKKIEVLR